MELNNVVMTLLIGEGGARIEVNDKTSGVTFLKIQINAEQFVRMMSREARVDVEKCEVRDLDKLGKKLVQETLRFEVPAKGLYGENRRKIAIEEGKKHCPEGWTMDELFNSQNSFSYENDKCYARTTISTWIQEPLNQQEHER